MTRNMIIAIDGLSASGKGTIAKGLAEYFRFAHLDTGLLYRAVGRLTYEADETMPTKEAIKVAQSFSTQRLDDPILRSDHSSQLASKVAVIPEVREALLDFQRNFAIAPPADGAVLDGRDIGTVICPLAPVKLFITADATIRAQRRHKELETRLNQKVDFDGVLQDLKTRDARDMKREIAPLKPAQDALILDTSEISINDAISQAVQLTHKIMSDKDRSFACI